MFKKYQLRSYNFRLVILLIVTSVYGIAVINSADSSYTIKQCAGLLLSLFVMVVVSLIDYNWLLRFYWIMYALNFVLLVLVLALGSESTGKLEFSSNFSSSSRAIKVSTGSPMSDASFIL